MQASEKPQHAIRRSTRLPLEIPVQVSSIDPSITYSERCNTTLVNAHGCGLIAPRAPVHGMPVRVEIVSAKRHTAARVAEVVPLGGDPETWLVGLELEVPGNFWGVEYAPSDWKIEEPPTPAPLRPDSSLATKPIGGRRWRLTDISMGACYLESATPFAIGTPVLVSARVPDAEFLLDGVVCVSHPQAGMGIAFNKPDEQRQRVEQLIQQLTAHREVPKIFVGRKEGTQLAEIPAPEQLRDPESPDPLLDLVLAGAKLTPEQFLSDLRTQRLGQRRDPRIDIALPVLLAGTDSNGRPLDQRALTVNISRRGALLEGVHGTLSRGARITLARGGKKEEFTVAWVVEDDSPTGARIGISAADSNTAFWTDVLEATSQFGLEPASLHSSDSGRS